MGTTSFMQSEELSLSVHEPTKRTPSTTSTTKSPKGLSKQEQRKAIAICATAIFASGFVGLLGATFYFYDLLRKHKKTVEIIDFSSIKQDSSSDISTDSLGSGQGSNPTTASTYTTIPMVNLTGRKGSDTSPQSSSNYPPSTSTPYSATPNETSESTFEGDGEFNTFNPHNITEEEQRKAAAHFKNIVKTKLRTSSSASDQSTPNSEPKLKPESRPEPLNTARTGGLLNYLSKSESIRRISQEDLTKMVKVTGEDEKLTVNVTVIPGVSPEAETLIYEDIKQWSEKEQLPPDTKVERSFINPKGAVVRDYELPLNVRKGGSFPEPLPREEEDNKWNE